MCSLQCHCVSIRIIKRTDRHTVQEKKLHFPLPRDWALEGKL